MNNLNIEPLRLHCRATISVPGSKSINNRVLLLASLATGKSVLTGCLFSEDTRVFSKCLHQLGVSILLDEPSRRIEVEGLGGVFKPCKEVIWLENAGTAARFLTAASILGNGTYSFDGSSAMRKRPMSDLFYSLSTLGAEISFQEEEGFFPVTLRSTGQFSGRVVIDAHKSSQQASALLLISPYADGDFSIELEGDIVSSPYIEMSCSLMEDWGVVIEKENFSKFRTRKNQKFCSREYMIEPDASSASYFFAIAAATGGKVELQGLSINSIQGDMKFLSVLEKMGCSIKQNGNSVTLVGPEQLSAITVDMNDISDTAPTLAAIASKADGPVNIVNVEHMRLKETDRIDAMATELRKMGAIVNVMQDGLQILPGDLKVAEVETYKDHRMAMSLSVAGLVNAGVVVQDPLCVEKTFPNFFEVLSDIRRQSLH